MARLPAGRSSHRRLDGDPPPGAHGESEVKLESAAPTAAAWRGRRSELLVSMSEGGNRPRAVISWSSGKDSAFALYEVRRTGSFDVVGLLTTITRPYDRVSMHGVREPLLDQQARAAGLPVLKVEIPTPCPNATYERAMTRALAQLQAAGVEVIVFGDLFLEDIRRYRESRMDGTGLRPEFPLWGRPTAALARTMIASGMRSTIVCLDPRLLPARFAGRQFDDSLLAELPPTVDPCGERGEFHTFVSAGPMFLEPVPVVAGAVVERDGFVFADLLLQGEPTDPGIEAEPPPRRKMRNPGRESST